jgi:hypothetical protein
MQFYATVCGLNWLPSHDAAVAVHGTQFLGETQKRKAFVSDQEQYTVRTGAAILKAAILKLCRCDAGRFSS